MNEENQQSTREQMVSLAEIFEVRDEGCLSSPELLAVLAAACEFLRAGVVASGVFAPETLYITRSGSIKISFWSLNQALKDFIPPELKKIVEEDPSAADSLLIGDAQLVWCLGQVASQASLPNFLDVGLFSLLNLMTVEHVASRPSLSKLSQMLRNKIQNADDVPAILVLLYQELMGDIDELIDDKFCDDIRFSSTRSSLSIVSGAGAPLSTKQLQITGNESDRQKPLIEDYLMHPASRSGVVDNEDEKTDVEEDVTQPIGKLSAPAKEMPHTRFIKKSSTTTHTSLSRKSRQSSGSSTAVEEDDDEEDSLKPFNEVPRVKQQAPKLLWTMPEQDKMDTSNGGGSSVSQRPNVEPVQVEVHSVITPHFPQNQQVVSARKQPIPQSVRSNNHAQPTAQSTPLAGASGVGQPSSNNISMVDSIEPFEKIELPADMLPSAVNQQEVIDDSDHMDCMPSVKTAPAAQHLDQLNFSRQNSLQPSKVQRRSSSRRVSNNYKSSSPSVATPEFLEKNSMPLIRLRAQSIKKKKVTLHRAENSMVVVKLLNGQSVEVNCRTDAYVSNVFDTVAAHLNITEHIFFGLAMLRNSEYFFLDNDHRLEKSAPSGWKNSKSSAGNEYTLMLRFRYYPKKIEFIKTETTTHNLYLQLRQDMLSGCLRFEINKAIELAAIALQVEYGDHKISKQLENGTSSSQYFKLVNYLPSKFYPSIDENPCETESQIVGRHSEFAGLGRVEAERLFIQSCQAELGYGAHYYRVFKIKPSTKSPYYNRYSDVHLIAVMPYGIGICREQSTGHRYIATTHEWHMIRTLQFDRKRFLIATIENNIAVDHVFYTEHYTKSSYLVRFAATQHRFMMKMRQWQSTLNRVGKGGSGRLNSSRGDVGVDVGFTTTTTTNHQQQQQSQQQLDQQSIDETIKSVGRWKSTVNNHKDESMLKEGRLMSEIDTDYIQYCYGSDAMKLTVVLEKHPDQGLGLTLVDGAVNGVKGVYVKSVSSGGDGKRKGLNIGDCLLRINEVSLFNKSRHDAVELVKECEKEVKLEVLRFPSITEVLACNNNTGDASVNMSSTTTTSNGQLGTVGMDSSLNTTMPSISPPKVSVTSMAHSTTGSSRRTPPTGRKASKEDTDSAVSSSPYLGVLQKRQRAVSDFGAIGDNLPALNSDDLLNIGKPRKSRDGAPTDSSSSDGEGGDDRSSQLRRGEYNLPPVSQMYNLNAFSDEDEDDASHQAQDWTKKTTLRPAPGAVDLTTTPKPTTTVMTQTHYTHLTVNNKGTSKGQVQYGVQYSRKAFCVVESGKLGSCVAVQRSFKRQYRLPPREKVPHEDSIKQWFDKFLNYGDVKRKKKGNTRRQQNTLDWTNDLSDIEDNTPSSDSTPRDGHRRRRVLTITILKTSASQSLGFQIASATSNTSSVCFFVKQVNAEPAISANLHVDDVILSINGTSIEEGYDHQKVVNLLRSSSSSSTSIVLEVERNEPAEYYSGKTQGTNGLKHKQEEEETVSVMLDKSQSNCIGLSLAKRMGHDGIFIRNIAVGSLAAQEGSLRVGDRIWQIDGENVADESPASIVKKLKDIDGCFEIQVKRLSH